MELLYNVLMENQIEEINKTFFGKDRAKEYVTNDLELCIERFVQQQIVDRKMAPARAEYDNEHHYPSGVVEYDGEKYEVTSVGIIDLKHARALATLQKSCMDALMLSLRSLFANGSHDYTSGGAFLRTLRNLPDLGAAIQAHRRGIPYRTEQAVAQDSRLILELQSKLNTLYDKLYLRPGGKYANTYSLLEEYQRDNFHKDRWLNGGKFEVEQTTEPDELFGEKITYHKKHKYQIQSCELHKLLNDFAEVVLLYARLGIFPSAEGQLAPSLRNGASLRTMIKEYDAIYFDRLSESERREIADVLKTNMPSCLQFMHLK